MSRKKMDSLMRLDLVAFIDRSFRDLNPNAHLQMAPYIEFMAAKLTDCAEGRCRRLIINLPPRHLKSHCASIAAVAWILGHSPSRHVICASYGQELADKLARDTRRIMETAWYQRAFPTRLSSRQAVHDFATTAGGTRMATSVGGVLTGRGADIIIIDDPLKPDEALSDTRRSAVNDWYDHTLLSRLNDKREGVIIIIMQRLHQDDLVGHVLGQEPWDVVSFPAIALEDQMIEFLSPYGRRAFFRAEGTALHPGRESLETLQRIRASIGEYNFDSQYQQTPMPKGGALIKTAWLNYYDPDTPLPEFIRIVQSWDTANKSTELSDYSVCTTWGSTGEHYYLLDVFRARLEYPELKRKVIELSSRYPYVQVVIEDKGSGTQLYQELKGAVPFGLKPYTPLPSVDKVMRLHTQSIRFESGQVLLPRWAPWLEEYVKELTGFPGTRYDDQVDSTTQALAYLQLPCGLETWVKLGRQ